MISVIIPTYNRGEKVLRAVDSALKQTYVNIEVLVVDDGSTDETPGILKNHLDKRVHYFRLPHSGHPSVPRNYALEKASGELVAFLDSDDEWLPEKLALQIAVINKFPEVGLVCSNAFKINEQTQISEKFHPINTYSEFWQLEKLLIHNPIICSSVITYKKIISGVGGFSTNNKLRSVEDYFLWLLIANISQVYYIEKPLLLYHISDDSITKQQTPQLINERLLYILDNFVRFSPNTYIKQKKIIDQKRVEYNDRLLKIFYNREKSGAFLLKWLRRFRLQPFRRSTYQWLNRYFKRYFRRCLNIKNKKFEKDRNEN